MVYYYPFYQYHFSNRRLHFIVYPAKTIRSSKKYHSFLWFAYLYNQT